MSDLLKEKLGAEYRIMIKSAAWNDLMMQIEAEIQKEKEKFFSPDFSRNPSEHRIVVEGMNLIAKKIKSIAIKYLNQK